LSPAANAVGAAIAIDEPGDKAGRDLFIRRWRRINRRMRKAAHHRQREVVAGWRPFISSDGLVVELGVTTVSGTP